MAIGAEVPPDARPSWLSRNGRWLRAGGVLAAMAVIVIVVTRLVSGPAADAPELDPEAVWTKQISHYGVSPVFPPEEDFAVGDVFAQIDVDGDKTLTDETLRITPETPFLKRAVKLVHVDVNQELDRTYKALPFFGDPNAKSALDPANANLFNRARTALPIAAFPDLTVSGTKTAAAGLAAKLWGLFSFGASSDSLESLKLGSLETYGLTDVVAGAVLEKYCSDPETKTLCDEKTIRRYLQPLIGIRILSTYLDPHNSQPYYPVSVKLFIVSRVYLARHIANQVRYDISRTGNARLVESPPTDPPAAPQAPSGDAATPQAQIEQLKKELSAARMAAGGTYNASSGQELGLNQDFARPVTIGYRYVSYDLDRKP